MKVRRSFVKMVATGVVVAWVLGFAVIVLWVLGQEWTEESARSDGVFLVHDMLKKAPKETREERLAELRPNFYVRFALVDLDAVEAHIGRRPSAGEVIGYRENVKNAYMFLVFDDGEEALQAGPVNPAVPKGAVPIGLVMGVILLPVITGWIALSVERQLSKVEVATEALATGVLSARVETDGKGSELAERFNAMAERVERLVRGRDELVQAVSHELGTPLSRLRFHLELFGAADDDQRQKRMAAMTRDLDALDELVAELLTYIQSDDLAIEPMVFDPSRSLNDLTELAQLDGPDDRDVDVSLELEMPPGATVMADQRLFQRAVENTLRNAMKYARAVVRVEVTEDADHVRVAVHDDGPGIPEDMREKVTVPFFRLDADRDRKTGGVGLGLAIVSRIMHRHGGHVAIATSPLGGAAVETVWPKRA